MVTSRAGTIGAWPKATQGCTLPRAPMDTIRIYMLVTLFRTYNLHKKGEPGLYGSSAVRLPSHNNSINGLCANPQCNEEVRVGN